MFAAVHLEFIENWPLNTPDLSSVDYSAWEALQQMVYRQKISDIDWLEIECVLIDCWTQLCPDTLNRAIDQLTKRFIWSARQRVPMLNLIWTNTMCE